MSSQGTKARGRTVRGKRRGALPAIPVAFLAALLAAGLAAGTAGAQADLAVVGAHALAPSAAPGGELQIEFDVTNMGMTTTENSGILNYVFLWDISVGAPSLQLSPTADHCAYTLQVVMPGEMLHYGPFPVTIPADAPLDTTLFIAVVTDWADLELEPDELNNVAVFPIAIAPPELVLTPAGMTVPGSVGLPYHDAVYQFAPMPGEWLFGEVFAQRAGSALDPQVSLLGPGEDDIPVVDPPDSLIASEGHIEELGLDSRITAEMPDATVARLTIGGGDGTASFFDVYLDVSLPEVEPNDVPGEATPFEIGRSFTGTLDVPGDVDCFAFVGQYGDMITIDVDAHETFPAPEMMTLNPMVTLRRASGDTLRLLDDQDEYDPRLFVILPESGAYTLAVTDAPGPELGTGFPEYRYVARLTRTIGYELPDLALAGLGVVPGVVHAGDSLDVEWVTTNQGGFATQAGGVSVDFVLSDDPVVDPLDGRLSVGDFEGDIPPMGVVAGTKRILIPVATIPGPYFVGAVLDPTADEVEADETNNTAGAVPIQVLEPTGVPPGERLPLSFALLPPRPNPSRGAVAIEYHVPANAGGQSTEHRVRIEVLSVTGQRVATLVDGTRPSGVHRLVWTREADGSPVAPGTYFLRIVAGAFARTERLIILS